MDKIKLLAICGSTRAKSSNLDLIKAIADLAVANFSVNIFEELANIPHFNPDLDNEDPPAAVAGFRSRLREADAIMICTPEYAMGVPGTLKNAIDWTVSSMEFSHKPVALITASLSGEKAHASLLGTLAVIEARVTENTQLVIPFIKTKINAEGKINHDETLLQVQGLLQSFNQVILEDKLARGANY